MSCDPLLTGVVSLGLTDVCKPRPLSVFLSQQIKDESESQRDDDKLPVMPGRPTGAKRGRPTGRSVSKLVSNEGHSTSTRTEMPSSLANGDGKKLSMFGAAVS